MALYVYTNNFFMVSYILDFFRKITKPSLQVEPTFTPISSHFWNETEKEGNSAESAPLLG